MAANRMKGSLQKGCGYFIADLNADTEKLKRSKEYCSTRHWLGKDGFQSLVGKAQSDFPD
jgi:hypothetical protein